MTSPQRFRTTILHTGKSTMGFEIPPALDTEPAARQAFEKLSSSNQSWHVLQVEGTKVAGTRAWRIEKSVAALRDGKVR